MDELLSHISRSVGFPVDQLKYILCLLCCYPAAIFFSYLPRNVHSLKHLYSIILSIGFSIFCLGPYAWMHSFFSSLVTYCILLVFPHGIAHKVAFVWVMLYMSFSHLYRQYIDYMGWTLDFTTMQMVLTLKLTSFAFNYYDGKCPPKELSEEQRKRCIHSLPSLLEFFGFVYFFSSFLAGPAIEIREYQKFINYEMFGGKYEGKAPPRAIPALKMFFQSLLFLPFTILSSIFPVSYLVQNEFLFRAPMWEKMLRIYVHTSLFRSKYYFGWFLTEGSCILAGIGYNGEDSQGNIRWDRCRNVDFLAVELAPNMRSITTFWNMRTSDWLKNYIYFRLSPEGTKPSFICTIGTYAVSAFWHGFYPGYYSFFFLSAIYTELAKDTRRFIRPYFMIDEKTPKYPHKYFYDIATIIFTSWMLNYGGASFVLLSFENGWRLAKSVYFIGHTVPIAFWLFLRIFPFSTRKREKTKEN